MSCCKYGFLDKNEDIKKIDEVLKEYKNEEGNLIKILQMAQNIYGYLPINVLDYIGEVLNISSARIYGVATFYSQFKFEPVGKYLIMLCKGTACHVNGADMIAMAIKDELKIDEGETTEDGLFTLSYVACLGCCSLSPVMMINEDTFGKLTPKSVRKIIRDIKKKEEVEDDEN